MQINPIRTQLSILGIYLEILGIFNDFWAFSSKNVLENILGVLKKILEILVEP